MSLWEQRFAEFESSGKTIAAWCKEQSIKESQFYYWRKKLRMGQAKEQPVKWLAVNLNQGKLSSFVTMPSGSMSVR